MDSEIDELYYMNKRMNLEVNFLKRENEQLWNSIFQLQNHLSDVESLAESLVKKNDDA